MNNLFIISILLFIIITVIITVIIKVKEPMTIEYTDEMIQDNLDLVIKYLNNSVESRENGKKNNNFFSDDKYQKQLLPLQNAVNYANYIKNKISIKK
jgi:hypothetical protein